MKRTTGFISSMLLVTCCLALGCDTPPAMMMPDAGPIPSATPSPSPEPTMPPKVGDPPDAEVVPHCEMKILDSDLLVEKVGSGEQITDIRVATNDQGFAITWRNYKSTLPTMFRSFDWNHTPTSDVVHLGDLQITWGNGFIGGTDDYLITDSKYITDLGKRPIKWEFRRVSALGELGKSSRMEFTERETGAHVMYDGKYYRVTAMRQLGLPTYCKTEISSWQIGLSGAFVHDGSRCIDLMDDAVNAALQSVLPIDGDVLIGYNQHQGGSALGGAIKIVSLKGTTDWTPVTTSPGGFSFTLLERLFNTPTGMKMLWLKGGERFVSSLEDGMVTSSYAIHDIMSLVSLDGDFLYGVRQNKLDNKTEFLQADAKGKTVTTVDLKVENDDWTSYILAGKNGKFIFGNFSWSVSTGKAPQFRTLSCY